MASNLVKGTHIDTDKVTFSQPKVLDNGAKLIYVNYESGKFNVQTPWMDLPWNLSCFSEGPYPKYSCELSFRGMDENHKLQGFHDKLLELENHIIDTGVENGSSWFKMPKNKVNRDVISSKFGNMIKVSRDKETGEPDGKYAPTIKLKVPCRNGVWEPKLSSDSGVAFNINVPEADNIEDILVKNAKIRCIMSCVGLWIASGNYMCQWKLVKGEVKVPESSVNNEFLPDSDESGDEEVADAKTEPQMLDDSSDGGVPEPGPDTVSSGKKKVLKRKKVSSE